MKNYKRKVTPKVAGGMALRKNNHVPTPNYWNTDQEEWVFDIRKPGKGFKHFLKKRDILTFISLIPDWERLSKGLNAIVLDTADGFTDGVYYYEGVITIEAWEKEKDVSFYHGHYQDHKGIFDRLGVKAQRRKDIAFCQFTEEQIKAYQLLHVFLHELGHHYDRMQTRSKARSARGEAYAENFAYEYEAKLWHAYQDAFGVVFS